MVMLVLTHLSCPGPGPQETAPVRRTALLLSSGAGALCRVLDRDVSAGSYLLYDPHFGGGPRGRGCGRCEAHVGVLEGSVGCVEQCLAERPV